MRKPIDVGERTVTVTPLLLLLAGSISWQPWSPEVFDEAEAEGKMVLLDLGAVWCHWCHVMDRVTYRDPEVVRLIAEHYVAVRVDQDQRPDLAQRYEDYGWPATIVFAADGSEVVKRRGYLPPRRMASMLQAIVDDPTPGPSVVAKAPFSPTDRTWLTKRQVESILIRYFAVYDEKYGGWGTVHKYVHPESMEYALNGALKGNDALAQMARQTLDANLALIDPVWGGVFQYSDTRVSEAPWSSPHYEKIMSFQASGLALYSLAYRVFGDARYEKAARDVYRYLDQHLKSPEGAYYASQDADVSETMTGRELYAMDDAARRRVGAPRIDRHLYARENGWAIRAIAEYAGTFGDEDALGRAVAAAEWVLANRRRLDGFGFIHTDGAHARYLGDDAAMAAAFLALHEVTAERRWLDFADETLVAIDRTYRIPTGGYQTSPIDPAAEGALAKPYRQIEENLSVARTANRLARYTGDRRHREVAEHAMRFLASPSTTAERRFLIGLLLADRELSSDPVQITVIGERRHERAQRLFAAALQGAARYRHIRWLSPKDSEKYPSQPAPAAYLCADGTCSPPILKPRELVRALAAGAGGG